MSTLEQQLQRTEAMVAEMRAKNLGYPPAAPIPGMPQVQVPIPTPAPAPVAAPVDQQAQLQALIKQAIPQVDEGLIFRLLLGQLKEVFKKALTAEDLAFYVRHIQEGAPGITPFLASADIQSLAQLINETYRSFLSGKTD